MHLRKISFQPSDSSRTMASLKHVSLAIPCSIGFRHRENANAKKQFSSWGNHCGWPNQTTLKRHAYMCLILYAGSPISWPSRCRLLHKAIAYMLQLSGGAENFLCHIAFSSSMEVQFCRIPGLLRSRTTLQYFLEAKTHGCMLLYSTCLKLLLSAATLANAAWEHSFIFLKGSKQCP